MCGRLYTRAAGALGAADAGGAAAGAVSSSGGGGGGEDGLSLRELETVLSEFLEDMTSDDLEGEAALHFCETGRDAFRET